MPAVYILSGSRSSDFGQEAQARDQALWHGVDSGAQAFGTVGLLTHKDYMTLIKVYGPYIILGVREDMAYGPNFVGHLVLVPGILRIEAS